MVDSAKHGGDKKKLQKKALPSYTTFDFAETKKRNPYFLCSINMRDFTSSLCH
jgi:hypothetical protein